MGFRLNRTYRLIFEGGMDGAEVVFKSTPIAVAMQLMEENRPEQVADLFVDYVQEWNLEKADGSPLPLTRGDILENMDWAVMARIAREWVKAAKGVSAPLDGPSTSGEQSPEESLPMEPQ